MTKFDLEPGGGSLKIRPRHRRQAYYHGKYRYEINMLLAGLGILAFILL